MKLVAIIFKGLISVIAIGLILLIDNRPEAKTSRDADPFITDRIAEVRIVMKAEDWTACKSNALAEQYVRADFWFDGELVPDVGVRPKGHSSLRFVAGMGSSRFSLKVDFNLLNKARNFRGLKKLNLNNGFGDPTLIRERLGYELCEQMGLPTPRTAFVDLWVNDDHMGVYTMVEQVDKNFLERHFNRKDGHLYKPGPGAGSLKWTEGDLKEQRKSRINTEQDGSRPALDLNMGGGKLNEIMQALGQQGPTDDKAPIPMPRTGPPDMGPPPGMGPPRGGGGFMDNNDANNDGKVSREEFRGPAFVFNRFDRDGDGYVLESEAPKGPPPGMGRAPGQGFPPGGGFPPGKGFPLGEGPPGSGDYLDGMGLKTNENNPDHSALFRFLDVLNNEPDQTFPDEIEKVLDVDQVLRFLAVSATIVHMDNYIGWGKNYYLYEIDGKLTIIPWDLNMAFGTFDCFGKLDDQAIVNLPINEPTCNPVEDLPLVDRLLSNSRYLDMYHGYLEILLEGPFEYNRLVSRIDELAGLVRPFLDSEAPKFYSTDDFEKGLDSDIQDAEIERTAPMKAPSLKPFVMKRGESIKRQLEVVLMQSPM